MCNNAEKWSEFSVDSVYLLEVNLNFTDFIQLKISQFVNFVQHAS